LIKKATSRVPTDEDDDGLVSTGAQKSGLKPLDYDLCLLVDWYSKTHVGKITVAIHDSEGFDDGVLIEMIELLRYCCPRGLLSPMLMSIVHGQIGCRLFCYSG
jgi:origin recognition complex subunit 3